MKRLRSALLVAVLAAAVTAGAAPAGASLPGLITHKLPWGANNGSTLKARLAAIGLHALSSEGAVLHIHEHLDLAINGRLVRVPQYIGINISQRFITELHTHDTSGIIHVESPTSRTFTLGNFFGVWGLRFTSRCIGGYCAAGQKQVMVWVNGKRIRTDPSKIVLRSRQEIVVAYGTRASLDPLGPIPKSYPFPSGY